jgi:hypothetical protein
MLHIEDALFAKYCNNQCKESEMGVCIVSRRVYRVLVGNPIRKTPLGRPFIDGRILLWILKKEDVRA